MMFTYIKETYEMRNKLRLKSQNLFNLLFKLNSRILKYSMHVSVLLLYLYYIIIIIKNIRKNLY